MPSTTPLIRPHSQSSDNCPTRACLIGVSGYAGVHYNLLLKAHQEGRAQFVGATIINPTEEEEKHRTLQGVGCRIYGDYREMLESLAVGAELCLIPTGIPLHREMAEAALSSGMNVLLEKPLAGTQEDAEAIVKASESTNRFVAVGYQHLYSEEAMEAKKAILAGTIGDVQEIRCLAMWPRTQEYYTRNAWAGKISVNGIAVNDSPLNNAFAHELMMMLFLLGPSERTVTEAQSVQANLFRANPIESFDTCSLFVDTSAGPRLALYLTHACQDRLNPQIHVVGTRGSILLDHTSCVVESVDKGKSVLKSATGDSVREQMLSNALAATRDEPSFICTAKMASCHTKVISDLHATVHIRTVRASKRTSDSGFDHYLVEGLEERLRNAYRQSLPLELDH